MAVWSMYNLLPTCLLVCCCLTLQVDAASTSKNMAENPLLIVSFDGFRWNYLERTDTPNLDKFLKNGVHAKFGLKNAFITKTFPNHYTLVTGLWEESHGIIANSMYDPVLNQTFSPGNITAQKDPAWYDVGAEPIWVTNQQQKVDGRSGVMMWVGGGAPVKGVSPSHNVLYDDVTTNETKIDTLIDWFTDKTEPINLGLLYFNQPDKYGHMFGPESEQVTRMIGSLDAVVGYLLERLEEKKLLDRMNIIITSDHGFTETPKDRLIDLDEYINSDDYMLSQTSPVASIWPNPGMLEEICSNLTEGANRTGHFVVYKREELPEFYHYTHNERIAPIEVVAEDTYSFTYKLHPYTNLGNHGYDNRLQDMHPFFVAMGPSFKKNFSVDTFDNVDVYPLMCHLLGLKPAPNNGSMDVPSQLLVQTQQAAHSVFTISTYLIIFVLVAGIAGVFTIAAFRHRRYLQQSSKREAVARITSLSQPHSSLRLISEREDSVPLLLDSKS